MLCKHTAQPNRLPATLVCFTIINLFLLLFFCVDRDQPSSIILSSWNRCLYATRALLERDSHCTVCVQHVSERVHMNEWDAMRFPNACIVWAECQRGSVLMFCEAVWLSAYAPDSRSSSSQHLLILIKVKQQLLWWPLTTQIRFWYWKSRTTLPCGAMLYI